MPGISRTLDAQRPEGHSHGAGASRALLSAAQEAMWHIVLYLADESALSHNVNV